MKNKSWIYRSIGIIILVVIIWKTDLRKYAELIRDTEVLGFMYGCLLVLLAYVLKSLRWMILLKGQKIDYPYKKAFLAFTASNFIAFITPGRLGEFAKVLYLRDDVGAPLSKSLPSVITDRLFDVYCLLFFGMAGLFYFNLGNNVWLYVLLGASLLLPFFVFNKRLYELFFKILASVPFVSKFIAKKAGSINAMKEEFQSLINYKLLIALTISIFSYLVLYLSAFILAKAIHLDLTYFNVVLLVSVANILSFLPITFSGIGTREAAFIFFLNKLSYSMEQALIFSTLFFVCFYIIGGLYGYICYMVKPISIKKLKSEVK